MVRSLTLSCVFRVGHGFAKQWSMKWSAHYSQERIKISGFPLCQTYKPTIILNKISKKMDQHTRGKWLIHGTKRRSDNQLQSLELPCRIS